MISRLGFVVKRRRRGIKRSVELFKKPLAPDDLMKALHVKDIYEGFDYQAIGEDLRGWASASEVFAKLIAATEPELIIEVGTWKGASAITMGNLLKERGRGKILCVDTWLGALEMWNDHADPDRYQSLKCRHGYPQVYYTFLANVCYAGLQDVVIPFPLHSSSAALWLMMNGVVADMVYLDASHEEDDVYQDVLDYYHLLRPGGVLLGDDWNWSGVRSAVTRFASENRLEVEPCGEKWILKK
ncbi:MAG: class I SAM-dependent methyltransferase [Verrucomicrobiia bacterium]